TDLRWELLTSLVAAGRAGDAAIDAELARDATATGERAAAGARAARPTPEAKAAAWAAVVEQDTLPNAVQTAVIAGFGRVHDRSLLAPYAERYLDALEGVWAERTNEMAQNIVVGLFPTRLAGLAGEVGVDVGALTEQWLAEHPDASAALRRLVVENLDGVRRAERAQERDRSAGA
ncbi:ERAP1-like C-terminal domain-containing protein, partial [Georgenia sp. 10Sc9-8]|nr:ERAP1-like C-terminal domain-containing protein [Georgenia halotolerans]